MIYIAVHPYLARTTLSALPPIDIFSDGRRENVERFRKKFGQLMARTRVPVAILETPADYTNSLELYGEGSGERQFFLTDESANPHASESFIEYVRSAAGIAWVMGGYYDPIQPDSCVQKICRLLRRSGIDARVAEQLTFD